MASAVHYSALLGITAPHKQRGRITKAVLPVYPQMGYKAATNRQGKTAACRSHVTEGADSSYIVFISPIEICAKGA